MTYTTCRAISFAAGLALALPACAHDFPGPHWGQIVATYTAAYGGARFALPTVPPGAASMVLTNFPMEGDNVFRKLYDDTSLFCYGAGDIHPVPNDTTNLSIRIDYGERGYMNMAQASDSWGHLITIPVFYTFHGISAGPHILSFYMGSMSHQGGAVLHSDVANLQCEERADPPNQRVGLFQAPTQGSAR